MTKGLEALEEIRDFRYGKDKLLVCQTAMYKTIEKELKELQAIKEAKPSEALVHFEALGEYELKQGCLAEDLIVYDTIKQALLKAQKQEKAFKLINKKLVNLSDVRYCLNYEHYKKVKSKEFDTKIVKIDWNDKVLLDCLNFLTQEEFDLLQEVLSE